MAFFLVVPAASVAAMLPVSLNGLGVREGVFVALLAAIGAPANLAASCALLALIVSTAFSAIGGVVYPFYQRRASPPSDVTAQS